MTVAQVQKASTLLYNLDLEPDEIVSFIELGSEGTVLQVGEFRERKGSWLIARNGTVIERRFHGN